MNTNGGITNIDVLSVGALYVGGKRFRDIIKSLMADDVLEQQEIDDLRNLLTYLNTTALTLPWIINNDNRNAVLKTATDLINTRLQYYDGTALTQSWVVNNDNRNAILKTRIDGHDTDLTAVTNKTQYQSSVQGSNTAPKTASDFQVSIGDRDKRRIYMTTGANQISCINDSTNQATQGENTDNQIIISAPNGMVETTGYLNSIRGGNTIEITGYGGMGVQTSPNIKIGNKGAQILIGSEDTPELNQTNTVIRIGKQTATKNTETYLNGNIFTGDARFESLNVTDVISWETVTAWAAEFTLTGIPYWIAWIFLSSTPNYRFSDVVKMSNNYLTGGLTKNHSIETSNDLALKRLSVIDTSVISLNTAFDGFLGRLCFQAFAIHGSHSIGSVIGKTNIYAGSGEVELRVDGGVFDWAFKNAGNCNRVLLTNDNVEVVQCNGSGGTGRLKLVAGNGNIELETANNGVRSNTTKVMEIKANKQVLIGSNSQMVDNTYKVLVDATTHTNGIKVAKNSDALLLNPTNVSSKSLTFQSGYGGATANTLYVNASNQLMYNGTQVGSGAGGTSTGGIIYLLRGPTTSVVYTAANLTTQVLTAGETYVGSAQKSIKLTTYNAGTTYHIYTHRGTINKITNPVIKGIWEYVINLSYSANQAGSVYVDAYFFGDVNTGSSSVMRKIYTGADIVGTGSLLVGQASFTPFWVINKYQFQFIFTTVQFTLVNYRGVNCVFRCTLEDDGQTVLYTFPDITRTSAGSGQTNSVESLTFTAPSQQTITQGFLFTGLKLRFRFNLISGTSSGGYGVFYNQPDAGGVNNLAFSVGPGSYSTPISLNQTNIKALQFDSAFMREYQLSVPIEEFDLTVFENPKFDLRFNFTQPSGATTNHFIEAFFNDGSLSHCHTALNITSSIPSLQQVMAVQGDTNTNLYFYGGAGIQNVSSITDTLGILYSVKAITAGTGINVASTAQGIYTISATGGGASRGFRYYNGGNRVHKVTFNLGNAIDLRTNQVRGTFKMRVQNNRVDNETTMIYPFMHFNQLHTYPTQGGDPTDHTWVNHSWNGNSSGPMVNALAIPPRTQFGMNPCFAQVELVMCDTTTDVPWIVTNFTINLLHDSSTGVSRGITCDGNWHYSTKRYGFTAHQFQQGTYSRLNDLGQSNFLTHLAFGSFVPYNKIGSGVPRGVEYADLVVEVVPIPTYTTQTSTG